MILLIDAEQEDARRVERLLKKEGYQVEVAHEACEAKGKICSPDCECALLCMNLGKEFTPLLDLLKANHKKTVVKTRLREHNPRGILRFMFKNVVQVIEEPIEETELLSGVRAAIAG